jgi:AraC-like DNA-binding protein
MTTESINISKLKIHERGLFEVEIASLHGVYDYISKHAELLMPHQISFFSIIIYTKNSGKHSIDFKEYDYQEGTVICIAENRVHKFHIDYHSDGYVISFASEFFNKSENDIKLLNQVLHFELFDNPVFTLTDSDKEFIFGFLKEFRNAFFKYESNKTQVYHELLYTMLKFLLFKIVSLNQKTIENYSGKKHHIEFCTLKQVIEQNFNKHLQAAQYADLLSISLKRLNSISEIFSGKSVKKLIDERLILEIQRLLSNSDLSVKEIAFKTGFDEIPNFVNYFKKHCKCSPSDFRKQFVRS